MSNDHENHDADHAGHKVGHLVPMRILVVTGLALLVLTWMTVAATRIDLGDGNIYIALGIAVVKAAFVALFFMHLWWDRPINGFIFITSLAFVTLFVALALTDTSEYQDDVINEDAPEVKAILGE